VVYAQLFAENASIHEVGEDLVDQVFDVMVRDVSRFAVQLHGKQMTTSDQASYCTRMIRRPADDRERFDRVWSEVLAQRDSYEMAP
jgi:acyl-CoA dehydrogenase